METLFDHNPTRKELDTLFGEMPGEMVQSMPRDSDTALGEIACLYQLRGDDGAAGKYLERVKDLSFRASLVSHDVLIGSRI